MSNLPKVEVIIYFLIWTSGILYSIYKVFCIGEYLLQHAVYEDFSPGWLFIGRLKDISDYEWNSMAPLLYSLIPWFFCHILISELVRWSNRQLLKYTYFLIGSASVVHFYGPSILFVFIIQPLIFHIALQIKSISMVWLTSMMFLVLLNMQPIFVLKDILNLSEDAPYLISITLFWSHLRCISFCLEKLTTIPSGTADKNSRNDFFSFLSYVFYLPLLFLGPVMLYKEFDLGINQPFKKWNKPRIMNFILNSIRYFAWLIFTEISLHYIYISALSYQPDIVRNMDSWTLFGLGYCMGQFFMLKYTVLYGIPGTFSRFERFDAPPPPKCIGRIHLYSEMWKYFDVGLYNFLVRYIYIPTCGNTRRLKRRLFASFLCFAFVFVWHGSIGYVLVWATLNFVGITIEGIAKVIYYSHSYQRWEKKCFSLRGSQRFRALIASPLLMMSALSNFYFFARIEVGNIFVEKIIEGWDGVTLVVLGFLYCCCQVSVETKAWEKNKSIKVGSTPA